MYFVGFNSMKNLIVILFNLLYPVFIVGFDYKGCVIERECVKTQAIEDRRVFAGISRLRSREMMQVPCTRLECKELGQMETVVFRK